MARTVVVPSDMANLRGMLYLIASNYRWFEPLVGLFSVALFLCAAWRLSTRDDGASDVRTMDLNFSLAVFATVLVSYHALGYDLCVLALPMLLLADQLESKIGFSPWTKTMIRGGLALLLFSPLQLVLLTRYKRLALIGWALLLCFVAMMSAPRSRLERT